MTLLLATLIWTGASALTGPFVGIWLRRSATQDRAHGLADSTVTRRTAYIADLVESWQPAES
jgi:hypothetical protein